VRIALLGTRGIPANYGGFETFAEELSTRLVERGHQVTVYCREVHPESLYRGVRLQYLPTIRHKYFDTIAHTAVSTWHLLRHRPDVALYCNGANAIFTVWPRLLGVPVALNVDGIERKRKKWNRAARAWYLVSEWLSKFCPTVVVTDALTIQEYYRQRYGKESVFIPYGAEVGKVDTAEALGPLGLEAGRYFLYVSRLEPENHPLEVREAFEQVVTPMKLALIGDAPYAHDYIRQVRDTTDPRIVMPGAIYGAGYRELGSHCFAYIHATEVGGTHPALIEAMGRGALVLYRNTPENAEVAGDAGIPFEPGDLAGALRRALAMAEFDRERLRQAAIARVRARYSWDAVTGAYEELLMGLVK
jgi:glycosyltransferase involved in cell wall biosynthesis